MFTRAHEKNPYTHQTMAKAAGDAASNGVIFPIAVCGSVAVAMSILYPALEWGNISQGDYAQTIDQEFTGENIQHLGMHYGDNDYVVVKDTSEDQERWRVYSVDYEGDYKVLHYIANEAQALQQIEGMQRQVQSESASVADNTYYQPSGYYEFTQVSLPFDDEGRIERISNHSTDVIQIGDNLRTEYANIGGFLGDASAAMSNNITYDYGFTSDAQIMPYAPENGWSEYGMVLATLWGLTLTVGMVGGVSGGAIGVGAEAMKRRHRRNKSERLGFNPYR